MVRWFAGLPAARLAGPFNLDGSELDLRMDPRMICA